MLILDLFKKNLDVDAKWVALGEELAGYEREILRNLAQKKKREFRAFEVKAEGPGAELESQFSTLDFFSDSKIFYLNIKGNPDKWPAEGQSIWKKLVEQSDPKSNWLYVSADSEKIMVGAPLRIRNGSECLNFDQWIEYFDRTLDAKLGPDKLRFLSQQNTGDILELKHWVELWSLGGDDWAKHALGWGTQGRENLAVPGAQAVTAAGQNLSYVWVDAALAGNKSTFLKLTRTLIEREGEDPIRLMALLGKSIKIMSQLALNEEPAGEPPFLISKMKRMKYRPELLEWWCHCDLAMKSTRSDAVGLLTQLP